MGVLRKIFFNINFWPLLTVFLLGILASRTLLFQSGYFVIHDSLQMMRQLMMEKCFLDGQIPCRWVPDMGYGFGFPLFNFYPPLPYLIGQGIRLLGFSFVETAKLMFALGIIASGTTMYFLAKEFFGRLGGVLAAAMYIWAPYHAVDVYVRGAMNESWALVWFPLILLSGYKIIVNKKDKLAGWIVTLGFSYALLLVSHNLMVMIFTPFFGLWVLLHLFQTRSWRRIFRLVLSGIIAFGLSAFFTLPALLENKFTHIDQVLEGYSEYSAHFATINQLLFERFWDYGGSGWMGINDGLSFQVGHLLWITSVLVGVLLIIRVFREFKLGGVNKIVKDQLLVSVSFMLGVGWFSAFMVHQRSMFIWEMIPQLRYVQFPWRFLTISILGFSFAIGSLPKLIKDTVGKKGLFGNFSSDVYAVVTAAILVFGIVLTSWNYFLPKNGEMKELTDEEKFSGITWELQQVGGIMDYLPITADLPPDSPRESIAEVVEGQGEILDAEFGTDWLVFKIVSVGSVVRIEQFDFPGWKVYVDGEVVEHYIDDDEQWGRMYIVIPVGEHEVRAEFNDTPVRSVANVVSVITLLGLAGYFVARRFKN